MVISDLNGLRAGLPTLKWEVRSGLEFNAGILLRYGVPFTGVCLDAQEDIVSRAQWIQEGVIKGEYKCPFLPDTYKTWQTVKSENGIGLNDAQTFWLYEGEVFSGVTYSVGSIVTPERGACFIEEHYENGEFVLRVAWNSDGEVIELKLIEDGLQQEYFNDEYRSGFRVSTRLNHSTSFEFALTENLDLSNLRCDPAYTELRGQYRERFILGIYSSLDSVKFKDIADDCSIVGDGIPFNLLEKVFSHLIDSNCKSLTIREMRVDRLMLDTLNKCRNLNRIVVSGLDDQELDRIAEYLQYPQKQIGVNRRVFSR